MARVRAVVPMKPLEASKTRLAAALAPDRRALLALAMFASVVRAACSAASVGDVIVVGGDEVVRKVSLDLGADWRPDVAAGLNGALQAVIDSAESARSATLYLAADLPLLTAEAVDGMVGLADGTRVGIAPDRWEQGTNALFLPAGVPFVPAFGDGSLARHIAEAQRHLMEARLYRSPGFLLDIDTPADLEELLKARPDWWEEAETLQTTLSASPRPAASS